MHKKLLFFLLGSILLTFIVVKYGILTSSINEFDTRLSTPQFILWIVGMLCIGTAAFLYEETEKGYQIFAAFNFIGIALTYFVGYQIDNFNLGTLSLLISALLFVYHSQLQKNVILGILCIAFCASFSILSYGIYELLPYIKEQPTGFHRLLFSIITDYSIYIFLLLVPLLGCYNLLHTHKLHNQGKQTLNNIVGFRRSAQGIGVLLFLPVIACVYYLHTYMYQNTAALTFGLVTIIAPLLIVAINLFIVTKTTQLKSLFTLLQGVLVLSLLSMLVFRFMTN